MKKKILLLSLMLVLTGGCFNNNKTLKCTINEKYEEIPVSTKITTKFKKGKANASYVESIMNFENNDEAQAYYDASTKEDASNMSVKENTIVISKTYSWDNTNTRNRDEIKIYFEDAGYKCK